MATTAGEGTSYEGGGGGAGGKFRKRPFRRPQMTPYDRPPTALRNPRTNGWISKLVDPASKLISASAHLFFSSFRKRLPPPPPPQPLPQPPEANPESGNRFQEAVLDNPPGVQSPANNAGGRQTNSFDSSGVSELEQILKQKIFTRSEIDRLTELLRSKTVDLPNGDEDNSTESNLTQPLSAFGSQDKFASSPMQENRPESQLESHRFPVSTPVVREEYIAAPAELAKAYMGSRPSNASPSMLGLRRQPLREEASPLNNVALPPKSPVMSLVPRAAVQVGLPENGFMTPRSRGRAAIYNMARAPYSRVHPTATQKGTSSTYDGYGGPSASSSSQFVGDRDAKSGSKQLALKRRSSMLEDNVGSVGPIRRLRQKTNLSTPQNWRFPVSGSPLSSRGAGLPFDSAQHPMRSAQKLPSLDEPNNGISKPVGDNEDNSVPGPSYTPVPSRSTEMAAKILQQLDKLVPKEKSSESKVVAAKEKSPSKLTPNMLRGQALRSLEDVDSSKILHNAENGHKLKDVCNTSLPAACDASSQKQDKSEDNHSKKLIVSRDALSPAGISNATVSVKEIIPGGKAADSSSKQLVTQPLKKKWAFQMSAHEDFLELDDEIHSNEDVSTPLAEENKKLETSVVESMAVSSGLVTGDKPSAVPEFKTPGPVLQKSADLGPSDWTLVGEKKVGFTFPNVPASSTISQPVVACSQSTSAFDKIVPSKELGAHPSSFGSSSNSVDKVPLLIFSSSSSVGESSSLKSSALLEPRPESSKSVANVFTGASDVPKILDLGKGDNQNTEKTGDTVGKSETSISSALSTSTSTKSIFSFGALTTSSSLSNGSLNSSPSVFDSPAPVLPSSNFTNSFINVASSTVAAISTNGADTTNVSDGSPSTSAALSFVATPIFKFGSTSAAPSSFDSTALTTSIVEPTDSMAKTENETTLGNQISSPFGGISSAIGSTGSSIFGFSASATSSANSLSQGSRFGISSEPLVGTQASPAGTGVAGVTQSTPIQFGSSAASPVFGTSGISSFSTSTSTSTTSTFGSSTSSSFVFGSSTSSSSMFGSSTPSNVFGLSTSFGQSSQASSSETNSVSSNGATSSLFSSNWQPVKPPVFSSTFNTPSPSTGFSFSASSISAATATTNSAPILFGSTGASSGSIFSFSSSSATASSQVQPVFASSVPVFTAASGNGDQMSMEDTMAEDPVQTTSAPTISVFGQPPISTPSSGFVFGSAAPSGGLPFQFGGQQNQSSTQNTPLFQPSGSLEFSSGGSFSLGSVGVDKANRKIVKVKHKTRRR